MRAEAFESALEVYMLKPKVKKRASLLGFVKNPNAAWENTVEGCNLVLETPLFDNRVAGVHALVQVELEIAMVFIKDGLEVSGCRGSLFFSRQQFREPLSCFLRSFGAVHAVEYDNDPAAGVRVKKRS